jgi:hypothetical protein
VVVKPIPYAQSIFLEVTDDLGGFSKKSLQLYCQTKDNVLSIDYAQSLIK